VNIGWIENPKDWNRWPEAEALLEPAWRRADDLPEILDKNDVLFVVMDGDELIAALTTAFFAELKMMEVTLVGGRDHRRWLAEADKLIGAVAAEAGATRLTAIGRRGWAKSLERLGWDNMGEVDGATVFSRKLGN
jgi:hypothetical protein